MISNGVPSNVVISCGVIDRDESDDSEKPRKNQLKNIQRYHEFQFNPDSITLRQLPGFGKGEEIPVKSIKGIAKFKFEVVNKEYLDKNGKCLKKTFLPYHLDGESTRDTFCTASEDSQSNTDNLHQVSQENLGIFKCPNPKCIKSYTSYHHYTKHISGRNCVMRKRHTTAVGTFVDMYIQRNGISDKYQSKTFRDARSMKFHNEGLPEIDPIFLNCQRENLYEGHALCSKRTLAKLTDKHKQYLKKIFNDGIKNKRKENSQDVEIQMRYHKQDGEYMFEENEWLTSSQIKSFFHSLMTQVRCREKTKDAKSPLKKKQKTETVVDETVQRCRDEESGRYLSAIMERQEEEDINAQMELTDDEEDHPIVRANVDLCALSKSIKSSKLIRESDLFTLSHSNLLNILQEIGHGNFEGKSKKKMGNIIVDYVKDQCTCINFQS